MSYKAKIKCSVEELVSQFLWPKLNKEWCAWNKDKAKRFKTGEFWKLMLQQYGYLCCELKGATRNWKRFAEKIEIV